MSDRLTQFLATSYTAYHAAENAEELLLKNGFVRLNETDDWTISEGGKYFVVRNGSAIVAFTVGALDQFAFRIVASHTDSPALKLKENAVTMNGPYARLNAIEKGLKVIDLGVDVPVEKFLESARENNAQIIACSALLTTTMGEMRNVVEAVEASEMKGKVKVMIGGAPITQAFCDQIGADKYTPDAATAADVALAICTA